MIRDLSEHGPLSGLDELPIHQCTDPVRFVAPTDPRFFERYWFTAHDAAGEYLLLLGIGTYPNLDTVDGYAILVHGGFQTVIRAHRPMSMDRGDLSVGPMRFTNIEPFGQWQLQIGDNASGLTCDLTWRDTKRAVYQRFNLEIPGVSSMRRLHEWAGYETFGRVEGVITLGGKQFLLDPAHVTGSRDHHWGTRNGVGGHKLPEPIGSHCGQWVQFKDWAITGRKILYNIGDARRGSGRVDHIDHKLLFESESKALAGGVIRNFLSNGSVKEIRYEPVGHQKAFLRCGMYSGPDGQGTPDGNIHHGMALGDLVTTERHDITDPATRLRISGFDDLLVRATCDGEEAIGILECRNPALYGMCQMGIPGYAVERLVEAPK